MAKKTTARQVPYGFTAVEMLAELRFLPYAEANKLLEEAPEEDHNHQLGMVYLERFALQSVTRTNQVDHGQLNY